MTGATRQSPVPISAHLLSTHTNTHCGMPLPTAHTHNNKYVIFFFLRIEARCFHPTRGSVLASDGDFRVMKEVRYYWDQQADE